MLLLRPNLEITKFLFSQIWVNSFSKSVEKEHKIIWHDFELNEEFALFLKMELIPLNPPDI